jgi:hypothetical protein
MANPSRPIFGTTGIYDLIYAEADADEAAAIFRRLRIRPSISDKYGDGLTAHRIVYVTFAARSKLREERLSDWDMCVREEVS